MAQHDLYRDKIEVSLDGRQIFSLFFAGAVIICTVFVVGVMVGKRVEARAHVDRGAAVQGDPLAALDKLEAESPLTFRSALRHGQAAAGSVDAEIAALAGAQRAAEDNAKRSGGDAAAKAPPVEVPGKDAGKESKGKTKADSAAKAAAKTEQEEVRADRSESPTELPAASPTEPARPDKQADKDKSESKKKARYTLQLSSFQERAEAESFLIELRAAGYAPTMTPAEVEGKGTFFRVRLGSYPSYDSAVEAKKEFERKVSRIAYVTKL